MNSTITQFKTPAFSNGLRSKRMVYACMCVLALSVSMYVYFVGKIVFDVVGRRTAEAGIRSEQSTVSTLEVAYFQQLQAIDTEGIASAGLSESHDTLYATRTTATAEAPDVTPAL